MFGWLSGFGPGNAGLERTWRCFEQMLEDGRHVFDAASNAVLGGADPEVIREDLFQTDRRINATEQDIRRQLVVHGSVHGATHVPELLVMMSLVKDAERIGDYAKNLFDLAVRAPVGESDLCRNDLIEMKDLISNMLVRARNIHHKQDQEMAKGLLHDCDGMQDRCDQAVYTLLVVEGDNMAAQVLAMRYFKRVTSHIGNIVTALVVPLDKLDFYDEPRVEG